MATLKVEHVYKNYGDVKAVIDACWECEDGEIISILGPSGCGKSSSLRMIAGLEGITDGSIYIGDKRVNELSPAERNIAMAFENYALYPHMTVRQNISYPLKIRKMGDAEIQEKCDKVLNLLDLGDIADYQVTGLSGGQKQRVSLGRALIRDPDVFLLDEPISHLDAKLRSRMRCDLKVLLKRTKNTVIYVTHDQLEAMTIADRIIVMNFGIVHQIGSPMEIYEDPKNKFVATFIGEPVMNLLTGFFKREEGLTFFHIDNQKIEIPKHRISNELHSEESISLGVRPSECILSLHQKKDWLKGTIYTITKRIDSAIYQAEIENMPIRVIVDRKIGGNIGDPVWVTFDFNKIRFFSNRTGERISKTDK